MKILLYKGLPEPLYDAGGVWVPERGGIPRCDPVHEVRDPAGSVVCKLCTLSVLFL